MKSLQFVALRNSALYFPHSSLNSETINENTLKWIAVLKLHGFGISERLLQAFNQASPDSFAEIEWVLSEVLGTKLNWTPLIKNWRIPTKETSLDHFITAVYNLLQIQSENDTKLDCGHIIPENTFDLKRYNGCPFCGTPFEINELVLKPQNKKLKVLDLWQEQDILNYFHALLTSKVPLQASQQEDLNILLDHFDCPENIEITIKEILMPVIFADVVKNNGKNVGKYFRSPQDILRYLWWQKTSFLQIIEPKTLISQARKNNFHHYNPNLLNKASEAEIQKRKELKLKYSRTEAKMVAQWLNQLPMNIQKMAEEMHPKRGMWVRFIRALRLAEYAKKEGFERLKQLMDCFYCQDYSVWAGQLEKVKEKENIHEVLNLLKMRPSIFSRQLFSLLIYFPKNTDLILSAFQEIISEIPMRLLLTLNSQADLAFNPEHKRSIKTILGTVKTIPANKRLTLLRTNQRHQLPKQIEELCLLAMKKRFENISVNYEKNIYIAPELDHIPLPIGDRSQNVQDINPTLMGERFPLEGSEIRLFMQWGKGLPAQHLDMDLSALIIYHNNKTEHCYFGEKKTTGCIHSGDIREIPNKVGTAEYININFTKLKKEKAKYVAFACNAYSNGDIHPNLVIGLMNAKYPMKVSQKTGVAYDPSCVMHQIRITRPLQKGLLFGILDVQKEEVIWLELPFNGQTIFQTKPEDFEAILAKLNSKVTIGKLLKIKQETQKYQLVDNPELADEIYDLKWAKDFSQVNALFID